MPKEKVKLEIYKGKFVEIPKIEIHEMECDGSYGYYTEYGCRLAVNNKGKYITTCLEVQNEIDPDELDYYFGQIVQRMYYVLSQYVKVPGTEEDPVLVKF